MSKTEETRARILAAARSLLEAGDSPVSMADIAERAGVTRQLLYVRFDGRAELLSELARRIDAEVRTPEDQARVDDAVDARTALRETVALQAHIKPQIAGVARALDRLRGTDEDAGRAWNEREGARLSRCREVATRLRDEGALDPCWHVDDAARLLWSLTSQRTWEDLVHDGEWTTARWSSHITRVLERALLVA